MLHHHIKIAFRNLLKYKLQSFICIAGLAIGFTCFALSSLWIRYELTYDTFRKDADRIYYVRVESETNDQGLSSVTPYPLARYLKETFPEIGESCNTRAWKNEFLYNGKKYDSFELSIDSAAEHMFEIELISGNRDFMIPGSNKIAITDRLAKEVFGTKNPMGEKLKIWSDEMEICAIAKSQDQHSNFPFGMLRPARQLEDWNISSWQTFIKVRPGTDIEAFKKKLYEHKVKKDRDSLTHLVLTSVTSMRYDRPSEEPTIKFEHILLFALAGGLVILCALFNYLTLFANRIRIRSKEIGLRKVCGSSDGNLFALFASEYLLTLFIALLVGIALIEIILPTFKDLSNVKTDSCNLYLETFVYFGIITLLAFLFSLFPIYYFRKRSLQKALKGSSDGKGKNIFPKVSLTLQLIISIGFIFCSSVLVKQIYHLHTTDLGLDRKDRGDVSIFPKTDGLKEEVAKLSSIAEVYPDGNDPLFPSHSRSYSYFTEWEGKPASVEGLTIQMIPCNNRYFEFYGLQLLKGKFPEGDTERHILLNEAAVKELKIDNPVGKTLRAKNQKGFIIDGIFKDFYIAPPTVPVKPVMLDFSPAKKNIQNDYSTDVIFRHQPGSRELCRRQVEQLAKKMQPDAVDIHVAFMEEEYEMFLKSEKALLKMLDFVTLVCILISLFGVFSQVTLDCEQRRKEIAVRKVNGATASDIMSLFFATNLRLLCIASVIAFPVSYLIMKSWIENYVLQATISWWLYPVIWAVLVLLLTFCTGWRIHKAANQNPAEVIKSE